MLKIITTLLLLSQLSTAQPYICFTDIVKGPSKGNTDNSQPNQIAGKDGAIVTLWGKRLGNVQHKSKVLVGGVEARVYTWGNATYPADLFTQHKMQMISFQIPSSLPLGPTHIKIVSNAMTSNELPFTINEGNIFYVDNNGDDENGDGSWQNPWKTLDNASYTGALEKMKAGDILYLKDGFTHTELVGDRACVDIGNPGTKDQPKAIIAYPGARASIGGDDIQRTFSLWVSGIGPSSYWTISKLYLSAYNECAPMYHGFRVVGNKITAPHGDGPTGAVSGLGNDLYLLGNEFTHIGDSTTSKLYHPIYIQSHEACQGPRLPTERNREIAWNYLHDNLSYDGINIYRECGSSAYMTDHRVHNNVILNQTGCGIRIGDYVTGENHIYNNIVIDAGLGPDPPNEEAMHVPVLIHAGWDDTTTVVHFYNNTIVGGGFTGGAAWASSMIGFGWNHPFDLDFRNNVIVSTNPDIEFLNDRFDEPIGVNNNHWFGKPIPLWDSLGKTGDPGFEYLVEHIFTLQENSPMINQSYPDTEMENLPIPIHDFQCLKRDEKADIGAFEYHKPHAYHNYVDIKNEWFYHSRASNSNYRLKLDVKFNLWYSQYYNNQSTGNDWIELSNLFYQNKHLVYNSYDENEHVYYDFSLIEGDTFVYDQKVFDTMYYIVTTVDSIQLENNTKRKSITLKCIDSDSTMTWIEGIGHIDGYHECYEGNTSNVSLTCFYYNGELIYKSPKAEGCWIVSNDEMLYQDIVIVPNPTSFHFTVQTEQSMKIEIIDCTGKILLQSKSNEVIDVTHLETAIYFLKIVDLDGKMTFKKLLKI